MYKHIWSRFLSWAPKKGGFVTFLSKVCYCFVNKMSYKQPTCTNLGSNESPIIPLKEFKKNYSHHILQSRTTTN